jgi:hypothetical protein
MQSLRPQQTGREKRGRWQLQQALWMMRHLALLCCRLVDEAGMGQVRRMRQRRPLLRPLLSLPRSSPRRLTSNRRDSR